MNKSLERNYVVKEKVTDVLSFLLALCLRSPLPAFFFPFIGRRQSNPGQTGTNSLSIIPESIIGYLSESPHVQIYLERKLIILL